MTQTLSALLVSLTALLSSLGGGITALNTTPAQSQVAQVAGTEPNAINNLTSLWEMNVNTTDRIAWDSKGNAHGTYIGQGLQPQTSMFGSGWSRAAGTQTPYNSGSMSVPGGLVNTGNNSFTYAIWTRHSTPASDPILGRGWSSNPATRSWNLNFSHGENHATLTYGMTDGTVGTVFNTATDVDPGELALVWVAYDAITGQVKVSTNGDSWVSATPTAPFQKADSMLCSHPAGIYEPWYPCTLDFSHIHNQYFPTGSPVIGRTMFWNEYIPTDAERQAIYNNGLGRDASYFGITFTQPTRPLSVSLVNASFANDANLGSQQGLYWLRPFPLKTWSPTLASQKGDYVWIRSTDHAGDNQGMHIGYSNSPETLPTSWTPLDPPRNLTIYPGMETPHMVWNPDTNLFHLYAHGDHLGTSAPFEQDTLVWTSPDLNTWTLGGVAFPANTTACPNTPCYNHTGYAVVERNGVNNWTAQSLIDSGENGTDKFIRFGLWSSTNGITWTFLRETEAMNPKFPYRNQQNQKVAGGNMALASPPSGIVISHNYVGTPYSQFELNNPAWPLFFHDGDGVNGNWLQDVRAYEENGTVYLYVKWNFKEPAVVRLYKGTIGVTPPLPSTPTISFFSASPASVTPGSSSTLSWNTSGATSLSINQGVGTVTGLTSKSVSPTATTTYILTATNSAGSVTAQTTVTVSPVVTPPTPDTQPPSTPTSLTSSSITTTGATLSWSPSSDNIGVTGYKVFRNSTQVATVSSLSYTDSSLSPATSYNYAVSAYDAAGNQSLQSTPLSVTTLSTPPPSTFSIGSRVKTTAKLKVRATPTTTGKALCTQNKNALGTITNGPVTANGYVWWQINYDALCDGWSVQDYLLKL